MEKVTDAIDRFWHIKESKSNIRTEIVGGITTFMAMAYILIVNPSITASDSVKTESIYIGTCVGALVGTLMMALYAKLPFAQAPGMGLNAYFAYTVINMKYGARPLTYANACLIVFLSGLIFMILTVFGIREKIVDCVPDCIKTSITAGIGLFIAFVGLQNANIIRASSTLVGFAPLNFVLYPFEDIWPTLVVLLTFLIICVMSYHKVRGSILWGIVIGTIIHYIVGYCGGFIKDDAGQIKHLQEFYPQIQSFANATAQFPSYVIDPAKSITITDPIEAFKNWGIESAFILFRDGWRDLFSKSSWFTDLLNIIAIILAFGMVDMFDTIGTLLGTAKRAGMLDEDGKMPNLRSALLCDSVGSLAGAFCGVSTVTTFVESSAGIQEGARTGFASLITSICFFIALWLSPLAQIIPSTATTPALIYVGVLMMANVTELNFNDPAVAAPAFMTIAFMPFSYNISIGIALGLLCHTFMKLISGCIYLIQSKFCKNPIENDDEPEDLDEVSQHSSSKNSSKDSEAQAQQEGEAEQASTAAMNLKEKGIKEFKQIHPLTIVIDVLFLVYFFAARRD